MAQFFSGSSRNLLLIVLFILISLACQGINTNTPEADISGTPQVEEINLELGPGPFDYPDPAAGLENLSSFKASLTVSFDGTQNGQTQQWSNTSVLTYQKEPPARTLTFETTAVVENPEPPFRAEMNGAEYVQAEDGSCFANPLDADNSIIEFLNPVIALIGVLGAEEAGQETVNGIETNHYTFDERALGQAGLNKSSGELWVASEGGYLVRYHLKNSGDENYFGEGTNGTFTWDYELSEVNQVTAIQLPVDCPAGMVDVPMIPNATVITNMPGLLQYETATSIAEALAYYEQELPKHGWTIPIPDETEIPEGMSAEEYQQMLEIMKSMGLDQPSASTPEPNADQAVLSYEQGNLELDVIITGLETATNVMIVQRTSAE